MFPQLLFIYVHSLRKCFKHQEFSFTNDFHVSFKEGNLLISPNENPYVDLWGERIHNINLLVGKNGAGKTTLLDLLGSTKVRRMELTRVPEKDTTERFFEEWFAIYHVEEDIFVIEGQDPSLIKNISNLPNGISSDYSICIQYDFQNKKATYTDYIQFKGTHTEYKLDEQMVALYLTNDRSKEWFDSQPIFEGHDTFVGFRRDYLDHPGFSNIYTFMTKGYKRVEENFTAKNSVCELMRYDLLAPLEKDTILKSTKVNLYRDHTKILLFQSDLKFNLPGMKKENDSEKWTLKEKFIIRFLESLILRLWIKDAIRLNKNQKCIEAIELLAFDADHLGGRVRYLNQVLNIINLAIETSLFFDTFGFDITFVREFIELVEDLADPYFISDRTLSFNLNDEYNDSIFNLLKFCEKQSLNRQVINIKFKYMSAGELEFVNGFTNLNKAIQTAIDDRTINTVLLLLDEPDASFHPEWSRRYMYNLYNLLNQEEFESNKNLKFQVIITTHSPFMVSDLPKEHITCIDVSPDLQRVVKKADFGLMSNFYDIIKNDFFITSPIGEYAKFIFGKTVKDIESLKEFNGAEIRKLKGIISSIGEEIIRTKLQQLLYEKELKLLPEQELIDRRIHELQLEIEKLQNQRRWESND